LLGFLIYFSYIYYVKIEIDLTGPQGNAYFLMGMVKKLSNQLDLDGKKACIC